MSNYSDKHHKNPSCHDPRCNIPAERILNVPGHPVGWYCIEHVQKIIST